MKYSDHKKYKDIVENEKYNSRKHKIYIISDPENGNIFYVGCTVDMLYKRMIAHITGQPTQSGREKHAVLHSILDKGQFPNVEVIYYFEDKTKARIAEKFIINFVFHYGSRCNLLNVINTVTVTEK